jgi:hypothetical protein
MKKTYEKPTLTKRDLLGKATAVKGAPSGTPVPT